MRARSASGEPDYRYDTHVGFHPFLDYANEHVVPEDAQSYYLFTAPSGMPLRVEDRMRRVVWAPDDVHAYGQLEFARPPKIALRLRFAGHFEDEHTGLFYNRFRDYDPRLGRYLQPDPIGIAGGENLYAYPANPLVCVDLRGLHGTHGRRDVGGDGNNDHKPPRSERTPRAERAEARREIRGEMEAVDARRPVRPRPLEAMTPRERAARSAAHEDYVAGLPTINGKRAACPAEDNPNWDPHTRTLFFTAGSEGNRMAPHEIAYDSVGNPDLEPFQAHEVRIGSFSSNRRRNFAAADDVVRGQTRDPSWEMPETHTWHEERDGTMRLVPKAVHNSELPHTGGVAVAKERGL